MEVKTQLPVTFRFLKVSNVPSFIHSCMGRTNINSIQYRLTINLGSVYT